MKSTTIFAIAALIATPALIQSNVAFASESPSAAESMKEPAKHRPVKHLHGKQAKHVRHTQPRTAA